MPSTSHLSPLIGAALVEDQAELPREPEATALAADAPCTLPGPTVAATDAAQEPRIKNNFVN